MNTILLRRTAHAFAIGLVTVLSVGCIATGDGYGYDNGAQIGIGLGYYEPYGSYYGGWGPGYHVGPPHGDHFPADRGGHPVLHAYKPAPGDHKPPSLPSRHRTGDSRP